MDLRLRRLKVCTAITLSITLSYLPPISANETNTDELRSPYLVTPVSPQIFAGIPCPVVILASNNTEDPIRIYELVDPYMGLVFPKWTVAGNESKVELRSLHYNIIPALRIPPTIDLQPNEQRTWILLVPTPAIEGNSANGRLEITIKNPLKLPALPADEMILRTDMRIAKQPIPSANEYPRDLLQAALLCYPDDALTKVGSQIGWTSIRRFANRGDLLASLLLFSKAVAERNAVPTEWNKLNNAPVEVRAVRNAILFNRLDSKIFSRERQNKPLSPADRRAVLAQIAADDPLGPELRRVLSDAPVNNVSPPVPKTSPPPTSQAVPHSTPSESSVAAETTHRLSLTPERENVVASRLEGVWQIEESLSRRLYPDYEQQFQRARDRGAPSFARIQFRSDPSILARIPKKRAMELKDRQLFQAGIMSVDGKEFPFLLSQKWGNPQIIVFKDFQGEPMRLVDELNIFLPTASKRADELLFLGGDHNNQPFLAYERLRDMGTNP